MESVRQPFIGLSHSKTCVPGPPLVLPSRISCVLELILSNRHGRSTPYYGNSVIVDILIFGTWRPKLKFHSLQIPLFRAYPNTVSDLGKGGVVFGKSCTCFRKPLIRINTKLGVQMLRWQNWHLRPTKKPCSIPSSVHLIGCPKPLG